MKTMGARSRVGSLGLWQTIALSIHNAPSKAPPALRAYFGVQPVDAPYLGFLTAHVVSSAERIDVLSDP